MKVGGRAGAFVAASILLVCVGVQAAAPQESLRGEKRPNVLLITLDTTRADHLGCYGDTRAKTPVLDGLAAGGAIFLEAHSHVPLTLPSHAVILTGDLPSTLNLRVNGLKLGDGFPTLATILKARGYWTGAFVSSVILERGRGLARGFDVYDDHMTLEPRGGGPPEERRAADVTKAALHTMAGVGSPYFLWVHYYDPHYEYRAPEPYGKEFASRPYDGEIAYMDANVGTLLEGLRRKGLLENTLVVVVADHGEGLMEHGERQHGIFLYEYALHVPLLMSWKGHIKAGQRIGNLCGLDDVAPTILDLLGIDRKGGDGVSLEPLLTGGYLAPQSVYIESYQGFFTYGWAPLRGIMNETWKFIEAPRPELYRWKASENDNLVNTDAAEASLLKKKMQGYPEADRGEQSEMERLLKDPSNAETLRQLASLGYLSGAGMRPSNPGLLDPKDAIGIEDDLKRADEALNSGDPQGGVKMLLAILKKNPQNVPALSMLGIEFLKEGRYERARVCFAEEVRLKPQMDTGHLNLGTAYKHLGDAGSAEKEYRAALALSPRMPEAISSLAQILIAHERLDEAEKVLKPALEAGVESADVYFEMGVLDASRSRWEKARFDFAKVLSLDPARDEAAANLGRIAFQQKRVGQAIAYYQRAARLAPRNASYLATLGSLYLNGKNDPERALGYYRKALAIDPYGPRSKDLREIVHHLEALSPGR